MFQMETFHNYLLPNQVAEVSHISCIWNLSFK